MRIVIIGGGIIGLSLAQRLSSQGALVHVFERDTLGCGASWAAAGMLGTCSEAEPGQEAGYELGLYSQELWGSFAAEIKRESGQEIGRLTQGTLLIACSEAELEALHQSYKFLKRLGAQVSWQTSEEVQALEPSLSEKIQAGILCPMDHQVNPRQVIEALRIALKARGVTITEGAEVTDIIVDKERVSGIEAEGEFHSFDHVVLASGWQGKELAQKCGLDLPLIPVKGHMAGLEFVTSSVGPRHVVRSSDTYIVPRADGRIVIGATSEPGISDLTVDASLSKQLVAQAIEIVPSYKTYAYEEAWAGIRPATPDGMPLMGRCGVEGLTLALGHHRNGILWAPGTAQLLSDLILQQTESDLLSAFSPARFM